MPSVRVTRGRLTALWLVLRAVGKLGGQAESSEVLLYARRSGLRGGGLPVRDGMRLAREGSFVVERAGVLGLADLGDRALALANQDEPPAEAIRLFVSVLLLGDPPPWVAWWQGSPEDFDNVIPEGERQAMHDAGFLPVPEPDDPLGWGWWEAMVRVPLPEQTAIQRKQIGDAGEQLTIEYERWRLAEQGHPELAAQVLWVAQESDAYGFDVLSFAGDDANSLQVNDRIAIEVKSTSLPLRGPFPLYLTAHEWTTARGLGGRYRLHLWHSVEPGPPAQSRAERPIILPAEQLLSHLPGEPPCAEECSWQTAHLLLPVPDEALAGPEAA